MANQHSRIEDLTCEIEMGWDRHFAADLVIPDARAALKELVEQYQTALDRLWEAHDQLCGCDKPADEGRCSAPEETWGAFEYLGERERDSIPAISPDETLHMEDCGLPGDHAGLCVPSNQDSELGSEVKYGVIRSAGRRIVTCFCNSQPLHEHRPHGGGTMILACPPEPYYPPKGSEARRRAAQSQETEPK